MKFSFKCLKIHLLSFRWHFAGDQTKMVGSEPSSATHETQNADWNYLGLNEAFNTLNYVDYMGVSLLQTNGISRHLLDFFFALYLKLCLAILLIGRMSWLLSVI